MGVIRSVDIIDNGAAIRIDWQDGQRARFHATWLRDNALDEATRSPANGQRLITITDIPTDTRVDKITTNSDDSLCVRFLPDNKTVVFQEAYLRDSRYDVARNVDGPWLDTAVETWDGALRDHLPHADFDTIRTERSELAGWLASVRRLGFAHLGGCPIRSGALLEIVALFGYVRETNYGRWFEVRSEVNPSNLAYTGLGLQAHTDNPYRDPVPTLQILYCLENSATGGESLLVDGFRAALRLRDENRAWFDLLSNYCARFEYAGTRGVRLRARRPMIELAPDGELIAIRFNNRSTAPITDVPYDKMSDFYHAYRRFAEIIDDPLMAITLKLEPGQCFIVDNTRVLHGRQGYTGTGSRHLQGCYADRDGLLSTLTALEEENGCLSQ